LLTDRFARGNGDTSACKDIRNYCGGTWQGITNHLDYIQGLGIDAVWISPVIDNTPGGFHGYWARDWTKLNVHFGDSDTLQNLVHAIHQRGMLAMVGVVANHVGPVGYNYSTIYPFNKAEHYHNCANCPSDCTIQDFGNQPQVELCRLSALPDLNQTNPFVRSYLKKWVVELVKVYGLDGIRIDTCPEVAKSFWLEYTAASGVFELGEVYDARIDYVSSYQGPVVSVLSYPLFFTMRNVFAQKQSMFQLQSTLQQYSQNFRDVTVLGTFLDNHDQPRFLSVNKDWISYKAALTFTVMTTGIPIIYYGTEQGFNGGSNHCD
jgi:alpha-amylase